MIKRDYYLKIYEIPLQGLGIHNIYLRVRILVGSDAIDAL